MHSNQSKGQQYNFALLFGIGLLVNLFTQPSIATELVNNSGDETKHIHIPLVHIDIKKHANGTKDVDVKAPFTNVHNPAGTNNAQVKAPFYKSDHSPANTVNTTKEPN